VLHGFSFFLLYQNLLKSFSSFLTGFCIKLFRKDERQKVFEGVKPTIKQAKSAENLVQVLPDALKCPCVSIKHALKKQGIKTPKPLISQGFQVSVSILVTQDGCGGRT
jgi:hypothetical protein